MKNYSLLIVTVIALTFGPGCAIGIGNRDQDMPRHSTLGQELIDLKSARDAGVLTEDEYQEQRERLMND